MQKFIIHVLLSILLEYQNRTEKQRKPTRDKVMDQKDLLLFSKSMNKRKMQKKIMY